MIKNPYFSAIIVTICVIIFYLSNTGSFFGKFINQFSPCTQYPGNSFPCFGIYDVALMGLTLVVGIVFLGIFIYSLYKKLKA